MKPVVALESIINTLFTAPAEASVQTEREYLEIWAKYLDGISKEIAQRNPPASTGAGAAPKAALDEAGIKALIEYRLKMAPVLKFQGMIDLGITMRVASVEEKEGSLSAGVQVGAFQASGSFGFLSQSTQESVMQARASYSVANYDSITLTDYLKPSKLELTTADQLKEAVTFLNKKKAVQPSS